MKLILLIIVMFGVFYIIDNQHNENNVAFENYTIEQLKKCDAVSKQADIDALGSVNSYRLNCKNNESIEVSQKVYNLQPIADITPAEGKEQKIIRGAFTILIVLITVFGVFYVYKAVREW